ncbi:hypothetical protein MMC13_002331 [Lambiella insularis]|nr:hypothetical protein [Lambiella insularis]
MFSRLKIALTVFVLVLPALSSEPPLPDHSNSQYDIHHPLQNGTIQHHESRDLKPNGTEHHHHHNHTHNDTGHHHHEHHPNDTDHHHHHDRPKTVQLQPPSSAHHTGYHYHSTTSFPTPTPAPTRRLRRSSPSTFSNSTLCPPSPASPTFQHTLFHEFLAMLAAHDYAGALGMHVAENVTQHDTHIADGRAAWLTALTDPKAANATMEVVHTVFGEGVGVTLSRVTGAQGRVGDRADFYRFAGTCLVEHWEVVGGGRGNGTGTGKHSHRHF